MKILFLLSSFAFAGTDPIPSRVQNNLWVASNTFTTATTGDTVDVSCSPAKSYAIQINRVGGDGATTWTANLEASLDSSSFTVVLNHTNVAPASGNIQFSGTTLYPSRYFRCRISVLSLGTAQHLVCLVLGVP